MRINQEEQFPKEMPCKDVCSEYAVKHLPRGGGRYEAGLKRCSVCEIFIKFDGNNCPCCGTNLREKPRNSKGRHKIVESKRI